MTIPNQAVDSSQAGALQPGPSNWTVLNGQPLEDFLQQYVAAVAALDGTMVRPRWQDEPPNIPDHGANWCSVGIMQRQPLGFVGAVQHDSTGDGHDVMQRHEQLNILISFYGPNCDEYSSNLHDGLMIEQNRRVLRTVGMGFVEITESIRVPEFIKNQWWDRVDKRLFINRIIVRNYPVLNLLSAAAAVITDVGYVSPVTVTDAPMSFDEPVGLDTSPLFETP
jgi:hypothetical protein